MARISVFTLVGDATFGAVLSLIGMFNPAIAEYGRQLSNQAMQISLPDMQTIAEMHLKRLISDNQFYDQASKNGFNSFNAESFQENSRLHLSPFDLVSIYRRGKINREQLDYYLAQNKIVGDDVEIFLRATEYFPSPPDLIRFAVREVYTPEANQKFGQFEDLPKAFLEESAKAGLPDDQARNYWAAHWDLPSPNMGFEMLHRGVIDEEELALLLRSLDVMPFWRDKLTKISYNPLTRVDTRRMYTVGILNEDGVYRSFLDEGYSPENARRLTDFTIKYDNPEIEGITRASIVDSYKKNLITKEELANYFKLLNYTDNVLQFWIENADYEKTVDRITSYTNDIAEQYKIGDIDLNEARQMLLNLDVPTTYVDSVVENMIKQKAVRSKNPSLDDLRRWLSSGLIDEVYFVKKLRSLGYKDLDIENYLVEISNTRNTSEVKYLPVDTYVRYMKNGIISPSRFFDILTSKGVPEDQIYGYMTSAGVI